MKKIIYKRSWLLLILIVVVVLILSIISLGPIINPKPENCIKIVGTLEKYKYINQSRDIQLTIKDNDKNYYLNHVDDEEINLADLDSLIGKEITLYTVNHWTPLDPKGRSKHVARVTNKQENKIVYSEF